MVETLHCMPPAFQPIESNGTDHDTGQQPQLLRYVLLVQVSATRFDSTSNPNPVHTDCKPLGIGREILQSRSKNMLYNGINC